MRLSFIFLVVLMASVLVTSLAAWGIIYGTSYSRVTTMSSEFTNLAHGVLDEFSGYVAQLLQSNSQLVNGILTQERSTGKDRLQQIKGNIFAAVGTLVNYTTNATVQSQAQMNAVVDTFAGLMDRVVGTFGALANRYAAQLRGAMATNIAAVLQMATAVRTSAMDQIPALHQLGILNLSRTPYDSIGPEDCKLLGVLCASQLQMGGFGFDNFTLTLATGRSYFCSPWYAAVSVRSGNASLYAEDWVMWMLNFNPAFPYVPPNNVYQQCMSGTPPDFVQRVGQNCSSSRSCECGSDQRCTAWYRFRESMSTAGLIIGNTTLGPTGTPSTSATVALFDPGATTPRVLAVVNGADNQGGTINHFLISLGASPTTVLAIVTNNSQLGVIGALSRQCEVNETIPGDPNFPSWSALRACDPGLRWTSQYIAANQATLPPWTSLLRDGRVWDIFPVPGVVSFFVIIGTLLSEISAEVDATNAVATAELTNVRAQQLSQVAATGTATRAYVAVVGAQNVAATEAMEQDFLAQIDHQDQTSRAALTASQLLSEAQVQQLTTQQTAHIDALKAKHLAAMSATAGWTVGVVAALLCVVLLASAWGTIRLTVSLVNIIRLMEDVADMRVENLEVPRDSSVEEVARIQTAFQVLVARLAEYKSYIPAGLFEPHAGNRADLYAVADPAADGHATGPQQRPPNPAQGLCPPSPPCAISSCQTSRASLSSSAHTRPGLGVGAGAAARKNVAVLAVNVVGFMEVLGQAGDGAAKGVFNDYVTAVHEGVSRGRGNVDCILGDQIFATFNAHIPCSDSTGAAVTAALETRDNIILKLGDKWKFQIGVSFGPAFVSSVGYTKFKSMVTVGSPMKVAAALSRLPEFGSNTILLDYAMEERVKFHYKVVPVELAHTPTLKTFAKEVRKSQPVFVVIGKWDLEEDEWMYQLQHSGGGEKAAWAEWNKIFGQLVVAQSVQEAQRILEDYLVMNPLDDVALRLQARLPLWIPGVGIPQ